MSPTSTYVYQLYIARDEGFLTTSLISVSAPLLVAKYIIYYDATTQLLLTVVPATTPPSFGIQTASESRHSGAPSSGTFRRPLIRRSKGLVKGFPTPYQRAPGTAVATSAKLTKIDFLHVWNCLETEAKRSTHIFGSCSPPAPRQPTERSQPYAATTDG